MKERNPIKIALVSPQRFPGRLCLLEIALRAALFASESTLGVVILLCPSAGLVSLRVGLTAAALIIFLCCLLNIIAFDYSAHGHHPGLYEVSSAAETPYNLGC